MAFLLAGVALGATAVALSEHDRSYYRQSRYAMDFLGNRNGQDIYKDRVTGYFYCDDGWDVRRVGAPGWRAHPVDLERLKTKLAEFSPEQLGFSEYILATFAGHEDRLWETIFRRFEQPKEPKKPHFGKTIRKHRWQRYDEEHDNWDRDIAGAQRQFKAEDAAWAAKRASYDASVDHAASGNELLKRALAPQDQDLEVFKIVVPAGKVPGDTLTVQAAGRTLRVLIPPGSAPGSEIQFELPRQQAVVVQPVEAPRHRPPQPAIGGIVSRRPAGGATGAQSYGGVITRKPGAPQRKATPNLEDSSYPVVAHAPAPVAASSVPKQPYAAYKSIPTQPAEVSPTNSFRA